MGINYIIEHNMPYEEEIEEVETFIDNFESIRFPKLSFNVKHTKPSIVPFSQFLYADLFKPYQRIKVKTQRGDDMATDNTYFLIEDESHIDCDTVKATLRDLYGSREDLDIINIQDLHLVSPTFKHFGFNINYHFTLESEGVSYTSDFELICNVYRRILRKILCRDVPSEMNLVNLDPPHLEIM